MSLEELRKKIDEVDSRLVELLNTRAQIVVDVGKHKSKTAGATYAPDREKAVLKKIIDENKGPLPNKTLTAIWRELMSGSFHLENPLRIAYLGPKGSFSHSAAMLKFGQSVEYEAVTDIRSIFDEVAKGHSNLGIVPIENSAGGPVNESLDAFMDYDIMICAEVYMPIHHNLLANCPIDQIEELYSKPEIFEQCRKWLSATFKDANTIPVSSSAKAAQIASEKPNAGAIGSSVAAELYNIMIVCENIEDIANNVTRFLVISKNDVKPTGDDKTGILFSTAHKAGALVDVLDVFRDNGLNLANIQARPSKKREWEYCFFVDFLGHKQDENVTKAVAEAKEHCLQLSILGSFPRNTEML